MDFTYLVSWPTSFHSSRPEFAQDWKRHGPHGWPRWTPNEGHTRFLCFAEDGSVFYSAIDRKPSSAWRPIGPSAKSIAFGLT
jgi:hypothetical protein